MSSTALKPAAPRLAETSWPARCRFACGARVAAGAEKTPASDVRGERLSPELGVARLRARKEERPAGTAMTAGAPELHGSASDQP